MNETVRNKSLVLRKTGLRVLNEHEQLQVAAGRGGQHGVAPEDEAQAQAVVTSGCPKWLTWWDD